MHSVSCWRACTNVCELLLDLTGRDWLEAAAEDAWRSIPVFETKAGGVRGVARRTVDEYTQESGTVTRNMYVTIC